MKQSFTLTLIYFPDLNNCNREVWIVMERMKLQTQAAEISFHCKVVVVVGGVCLSDRVRSSDIWRELRGAASHPYQKKPVNLVWASD